MFKDMRDPSWRRRYKMFFKHDPQKTVCVAYSADGVHWTDPIACRSIDAPGDTHNNAFWAPEREEYVGITRITRHTDRWPQSVRLVGRTSSKDFLN